MKIMVIMEGEAGTIHIDVELDCEPGTIYNVAESAVKMYNVLKEKEDTKEEGERVE